LRRPLPAARRPSGRRAPFLKTFALALTLLFVPLLAFGLYCLNVAVERAAPVEYCCSRRQVPAPAPRVRGRRSALR
jgi:hypothetical protein